MALAIAPHRLLADERLSSLARHALELLDGPEGHLAVGKTADAESAQALPRDLGILLQQVLEAVAAGATVTVMTTPDVITTSTAAAMLGISRPTLMKIIREGGIEAHKVGTHTRIRTDDAVEFKRARRERERAAFAALLEAEGDEE